MLKSSEAVEAGEAMEWRGELAGDSWRIGDEVDVLFVLFEVEFEEFSEFFDHEDRLFILFIIPIEGALRLRSNGCCCSRSDSWSRSSWSRSWSMWRRCCCCW